MIEKANTRRLEAIDVIRGLAALSVVIYHDGFGRLLAKLTGWPAFEALSWPGSQLAVPVFFVISGLCIHLGSLGRATGPGFIRRFALVRFFRIYPPWVVAIVISALSLWITARPPEGRELLRHLTLTNSFVNDYRFNAALWSVSVECLLYALYPFWLAMRLKHGLAAAALLAGLVSAASCLVTTRVVPAPTGPAMWFFVNVWFGWVAGAVLAEICHLRPAGLKFGPAWWLGGIAACALHGLGRHLGLYTGALFYFYLPVTIALCVWPVAALIQFGPALAAGPAPLRLLWRTCAQIGIFSYSLYLLHMPLQSLRFAINSHVSGSLAKGLLLVGGTGLILGVAWLCHRWVEAPSARLGRRLAAQWGPAKALPPQPA